MKYSDEIDIFDKDTGKIKAIFVKANSKLIKKYQKFLDRNDTDEFKKKSFEKLWQKEYKAWLLSDDNSGSWNKIAFKNKIDMTVFLMKIN